MSPLIYKNNNLMRCFTVILVVSALMGKAVLRECVPLAYDERFLLWKAAPCTLAPFLVLTLLGAFFAEKGFAKATGIGGVLLMLAMATVQMGSAVWLAAVGEPVLTTLYGYTVRTSFAFFLVATACLRGAASAVVISMLSSIRHTRDCPKESGRFAALSIGVVVAGILMIALRMDVEWIHVAIVVFVYIFLLVLILLTHMRRDKELWDTETAAMDVNDDGGTGWRKTILCYSIILLCCVTFISFWQYLQICWRLDHHLGYMPENMVALSSSLVVFAIGLLTVRNHSGKRNLPVWGSALLVTGLPLILATLDAFYVNLVPEAIVGMGLAMILGPVLTPFLKVPTKYYATVWVGTVVLIVVLGKLLVVLLNRIEAAFNTVSMAFYCIFPLLALLLLLLGYLVTREGKRNRGTPDSQVARL